MTAKAVNLPLLAAEMAAAGVPYAVRESSGGLFELLEPTLAAQAVFDAHDHTQLAPVPVPVEVDSAPAKVVLLRAGVLDAVEAAVAGYPREVQIWFRDSNKWQRGNTYVAGIGAELGLSDSQIDDLFRAAALLA